MIYQAAKFKSKKERNEYLEWINDLEFKKMNLPVPDVVIFLNIPPDLCSRLNSNRPNKIDGSSEKDIHERNKGFLEKTYEAALYAAKKYKWIILECTENDAVKPIKEINREILRIIENRLNGDTRF
jgi:dTMP kinase